MGAPHANSVTATPMDWRIDGSMTRSQPQCSV